MLEQVKASSDPDVRRKASENYGFIYGELIDTYYAISSKDVRNKLAAADNALRYGELNKSRIFTNSWGRTFIDVLGMQLPADYDFRQLIDPDLNYRFYSDLGVAVLSQSGKIVELVISQIPKKRVGF